MKFILLLSICALASAAPRFSVKIDERAISDALNELLEKLRIMMQQGDPETGFPVLDPLVMEKIGFGFDAENMFKFDIEAEGNRVTGLSDFIVHDVTIQLIPMRVKFDATLPMTIVTADKYKFDGLVFGALPIYGDGKAYFAIGDLRFTGFVNMAVVNGFVVAKNFEMDIQLGSLKSETTGMLGGGDIDDLINEMLSDLAPDFFNAYSDIISAKLSEIGLDTINGMLDGLTLKDLLDLISGGSVNSDDPCIICRYFREQSVH